MLVGEFAKQVATELFARVPSLHDRERDQVFAWAKRCETRSTIGAMVHLARGTAVIGHEELDTDPWILNVANGTVDLRTGHLRSHRPDDLCTMQVPVAYDPGARAPLWEACLERWQPDPEVRAYLQREAGAGATGRPTEILAVHHGGGGNGKSRYFGALGRTLGPYFVVPHRSLLVRQRHEQHDTVRADLFRRRLAVAAETDSGARIDEEKVKALTGGDRIKGRRMREDPWEFWPTHTLALFSNYRPRVKGEDTGIWRRLVLVPWNVEIPPGERDDNLATKLETEAPGILAWIVEGARQFCERGLDPPEVVRMATESYRASEDTFSRFVEERCELDPEARAKAGDLWEAWTDYCRTEEEQPGRKQDVMARLDTRFARLNTARRQVIFKGVRVQEEGGRLP